MSNICSYYYGKARRQICMGGTSLHAAAEFLEHHDNIILLLTQTLTFWACC